MVKSVVVQAYLVVSESAAGGNMSNLAVGYWFLHKMVLVQGGPEVALAILEYTVKPTGDPTIHRIKLDSWNIRLFV